MCRPIGEGVAMAYMAPYQITPRRPPAADDTDPGDRDPSW